MNIKLKIALICRSSEQGFAVPLALSLGVIMILLASINIFKSQEENIIATTQRQTNQALSAAEVGVNRYLKLIDENKFLAINSDGNWTKASNTCDSTTISNAVNGWQDVDSSDPDLEQQYKIVSYDYSKSDGDSPDDSTFGTLKVEGIAKKKGQVTGTAAIEVKIPVRPEHSVKTIAYPALWLKDGSTNIGKLQVDGNILVSGTTKCELPATPTSANLKSPTQLIVPDPRPLPDPPCKPDSCNPALTSDQFIEITTDQLLNTKLPRDEDADKNEKSGNNYYYHYVVTDDADLRIQQLIIEPGTKVILYVKNKILFQEGAKINDGRPAHYLEIYNYSNVSGKKNIVFKGKEEININAFIHAPYSTVKIANTTNNDPPVTITGAMWVKKLNIDQSSSQPITIGPDPNADEQNKLLYSIYRNLQNPKPITHPPNSWKTVEVN